MCSLPPPAVRPGEPPREPVFRPPVRDHAQGNPAAFARPSDVRHDRRHPDHTDRAVRLCDQHRRASPARRGGRRGKHRAVAPVDRRRAGHAGAGCHRPCRQRRTGQGTARSRGNRRRHRDPARFRAAAARPPPARRPQRRPASGRRQRSDRAGRGARHHLDALATGHRAPRRAARAAVRGAQFLQSGATLGRLRRAGTDRRHSHHDDGDVHGGGDRARARGSAATWRC